MNQVYELMAYPRQLDFACSIDQMNPELAEIAALHRERSASDTDPVPRYGMHLKMAGLALALALTVAMVIGSRWGLA